MIFIIALSCYHLHLLHLISAPKVSVPCQVKCSACVRFCRVSFNPFSTVLKHGSSIARYLKAIKLYLVKDLNGIHQIKSCCLTLNLWSTITSFLCQNLLVLMMVGALLKCLVTSRLGRGPQTRHGLCLQSNMHISQCSKYLLSLMLPGENKNLASQISASWLLTCCCNTFSRFSQLTKRSVWFGKKNEQQIVKLHGV